MRVSINNAVRELNYVPNLNARALASSRTNVVAVLVPSLTQNIFSDVLRGIYDGAEDSGLRIEITNTRYNPEIEERRILEILRHEPSALIVSGVDQSDVSRKFLENASCPVVQIMELTDDPIYRIVGFSHCAAGQAMTRHLIDVGYRANVAVLHHPAGIHHDHPFGDVGNIGWPACPRRKFGFGHRSTGRFRWDPFRSAPRPMVTDFQRSAWLIWR